MAVLSTLSVGDVFYYSVDDVPTHTAPKGSISIIDAEKSVYDYPMMYVNNDGSNTWLKTITRSYGSIYINDNSTTIDPDGTQTLGSWYAFEATNPWSTDVIDTDFYWRTAEDLVYSGSTLIRAMTSQSSTLRGGTSKYVSWEIGVSRNFTVPNRWNEAFSRNASSTTTIQSVGIREMGTGDYILGAVSPISRETGGAAAARSYIPKHAQLSTTKIDEALQSTIFNETFESGNFTDKSWTVVNDTTNVWVVGTAETNGGVYSAYVSNNGGVSAAYTVTTSNVSHFYKDFVLTGDTITLSFDWKCNGENTTVITQYDYGTVVMADTSTTPVAGTEASIVQATAGGNGRVGAVANLGKFNLGYGTTPATVWNTETIDLSAYAGQTKRIIFTWKNDNIAGAQPPIILDNIKLILNKW